MGNANYTLSTTGVSTNTNLPILTITGLYPNKQYLFTVNLKIGINTVPSSLQIGSVTNGSVVSALRIGGLLNDVGTWDFYGTLGGKSNSSGVIIVSAIKPTGVTNWQLSSIVGNVTNSNTFTTYQSIIKTIGN